MIPISRSSPYIQYQHLRNKYSNLYKKISNEEHIRYKKLIRCITKIEADPTLELRISRKDQFYTLKKIQKTGVGKTGILEKIRILVRKFIKERGLSEEQANNKLTTFLSRQIIAFPARRMHVFDEDLMSIYKIRRQWISLESLPQPKDSKIPTNYYHTDFSSEARHLEILQTFMIEKSSNLIKKETYNLFYAHWQQTNPRGLNPFSVLISRQTRWFTDEAKRIQSNERNNPFIEPLPFPIPTEKKDQYLNNFLMEMIECAIASTQEGYPFEATGNLMISDDISMKDLQQLEQDLTAEVDTLLSFQSPDLHSTQLGPLDTKLKNALSQLKALAEPKESWLERIEKFFLSNEEKREENARRLRFGKSSCIIAALMTKMHEAKHLSNRA